jgi:two-component system, cell cycle sensor histidine kinase and response regulator CckA
VAGETDPEETVTTLEVERGLLLDAIPGVIWTVDRELRFTSMHGSLYEELGRHAAEDLAGMTLFDYFTTGDPDYRPIALHKRALEGESFTLELEFRGRTLQSRIQPLRAEHGEIQGAVGLAVDVTEQREVERALIESEDRFRSVVQSLDAVVWEADARTLATMFVSDRSSDMLGYEPQDWYDDPHLWRKLIHPADREATVESCLEAIATGQARALEYRLVAADGHVVHVRDIIRVSRDDEGRPLRACGVIVDVTAERLAREALELSEERYRQLFEDAVDMIAFVDLEDRVGSINRAGAHLLGWEPEQIVGRNFKDFLSPESRAAVETQRGRKLAGEVESTTYEAELITESGRRIPIEICARVIHRGGQPIGTHGIGRDIRERREAEQRVRRAQQLEAVSRLAGGIGHDFNNLLTAIVGNCELALRQYGELPELLEIQEAASRATALTQQLLAVGRRQVLRPRVHDANVAVRESERALRSILREDVRLELDLAVQLPPVEVDPDQLEQVLLDLVANAQDAMPLGGTVTVATSTAESDDPETTRASVLLTVRDTGLGMDEETQARIFEPFFTTKDSGERGLGLASVYGIVKQSGGHVTVESAPGAGTTFVISLPSRRAPSRAAPTAPRPAP